ncbi:DmsC/YnfH family molybdoenzyme membrane anchor subunit [Oricola sp.]|uniref:dimethyl sulfoxide reductase anchor subunit family protein n=1 Tax=Oricola sp. TaxID=1979950 RepID=UPI0025EDB230|nr:DmsC/YnfH family molybdoenzyme membrane anchor subunit [Oricola sp.]MCI5074559.1 dimethyl sulfoxide reductase anchor subunit [Oricola sp.]
MHPAFSVIVFTTLSGIGFGLMALLGLGFGVPGAGFQWSATIVAFAFAVIGLLSSVLHLRSKSRAILAFSQWRSSWLSREGVCSVVTLGLFGIYSLVLLLMGTRLAALGFAAAVLAMVTVFTTSMIYAQLRTVPHWASWITPAVFLGFSIAGGVLALSALLAISGAPSARMAAQWAMVALIVAWAAKAAWWRRAAETSLEAAGSGIGDATGLGVLGAVRPFEPPHTSPNYLMREMAFEVGRKRARALRRIAIACGAVAPFLLAGLAAYVGAAAPLLMLAVILHLVGMLAERWLFFAEARHAVGSFYGIGQSVARPSSQAA